MKHAPGLICESCEAKLAQADTRLAAWFRGVKAKHLDAHISWSYRDEVSQNEAFQSGKSKLQFPNSPHNKLPAQALDLFQLSSDGNAMFIPSWFRTIERETQDSGLVWGGTFKTLGDLDHFQIKETDHG